MAISPSRNRLRGGCITKGRFAGVGHEEVVHASLLLGLERFVDDAVHHLQACGLLLRVAETAIGQGPDQEAAAHEVPLGVASAHLRQFPLAGLGIGPQIELLGGQPRGERLDFGLVLRRWQRRPINEVQAGQPDRRCGNERNHAEEQPLPQRGDTWTAVEVFRHRDSAAAVEQGRPIAARAAELVSEKRQQPADSPRRDQDDPRRRQRAGNVFLRIMPDHNGWTYPPSLTLLS